LTRTTSIYINDDGDDGDGGDGNGNDNSNGNGNGNSDDATAAAVGDTVDENNCGASRTAIRQRQLDNGDGTTTM
jgi:hypothetical protein